MNAVKSSQKPCLFDREEWSSGNESFMSQARIFGRNVNR